jgi:hypothetical protein
MSSGLTHSGAIARGLAYAPAKDLRAWGREAEGQRANVTAVKPVRPAPNAAEARERVREQVMAERGVDLFDLFKMGSQERIRAEAAIMTETMVRTRQAQVRATANFVDIRV